MENNFRKEIATCFGGAFLIIFMIGIMISIYAILRNLDILKIIILYIYEKLLNK